MGVLPARYTLPWILLSLLYHSGDSHHPGELLPLNTSCVQSLYPCAAQMEAAFGGQGAIEESNVHLFMGTRRDLFRLGQYLEPELPHGGLIPPDGFGNGGGGPPPDGAPSGLLPAPEDLPPPGLIPLPPGNGPIEEPPSGMVQPPFGGDPAGLPPPGLLESPPESPPASLGSNPTGPGLMQPPPGSARKRREVRNNVLNSVFKVQRKLLSNMHARIQRSIDALPAAAQRHMDTVSRRAASARRRRNVNNPRRLRRESPPDLFANFTVADFIEMEVTLQWQLGQMEQEKYCQWIKQVDHDQFFLGHKCFQARSRATECQSEFVLIKDVLSEDPPADLYKQLERRMCGAECENAKEMLDSIQECSQLPAGMRPVEQLLPALFTAVQSEQDYTDICRDIRNLLLCPSKKLGCCDFLQRQIDFSLRQQVPVQILDLCDVVYRPSGCEKTAPTDPPKTVGVIGAGSLIQHSVVILILAAMFASITS